MSARTHLYIGIEDLGLTTEQRSALLAQLRQLGPPADPQPARLCHWRTSIDGRKAIFEAAFEPDNITANAIQTRLAAIYTLDPDTIDTTVTAHTFANRPTPVATFGHNATARLRLAVFGGPAATWAQSRDEAEAYIAANRDDWETDE